MAPRALELHHNPAEFFKRDLVPFAQAADRVILAEDAPQVAIGKKDCARPVPADEGPLFSEMGAVGRNLGNTPGPAKSLLSSRSVHAALPGAYRAFFEEEKSLPNPFREKALFVCFEINGSEIFSAHLPSIFLQDVSPGADPQLIFLL
jgi:hypothetical protein